MSKIAKIRRRLNGAILAAWVLASCPCGAVTGLACRASDDNVREVFDLNDGWEGSMTPEKGGVRHLKDISLPQSWHDYHGMRRLRHGNLHGTCAYRRTFDFHKKTGRRQFLVFDGIGTYATVRVNGVELCRHRPAGRLVTTLEATDAVRDGANELEVVCEHPSDIVDMPWVCGGCGPASCEGPEPFGLFRPARLVDTADVRVVPFGIHLWYDEKVERGFAEVEISSCRPVDGRVKIRQEELGVRLERRIALAAGETKAVRFEFPLGSVKRWSIKSPNLYAFTVEVGDDRGGVWDRETARTGYRTIMWPKTNPDRGDPRFFLNGEPVFIHGVCETDHRLGGSMAFEREEIDARCDEIEKLGFNAFRDGHEPHDLRYSERWDEDGVLWWPQLSTRVYTDSDVFRKNFREAVIQWVRERRNSPSIVLWGLQNESVIPPEEAAALTELIHKLDPLAGSRGRLVTTCNFGAGTDWNVLQDWCGTYAGRFGPLENYENSIRDREELLVGEYGAWRVAGMHDDPDKPFVYQETNTEEHAVRVLTTKALKAWRVRNEVCGHFLWTFFTHEDPGCLKAWEGYRLIDKIGPVNYKGPYTLGGRRTETWYAFLAYGRHFRDGSLDGLLDRPLSWWTTEGRRLAAPKKLAFLQPTSGDGLVCVFRLNCGGDAVVDSLGCAWSADDTRYVHSWAEDDDLAIPGFRLDPVLGSQDEIPEDVLNAKEQDQPLFRTYRYGRHRLRFELPAPPNAECTVDAYFVEPGSYGRIFDVALNGTVVESGFALGRIPARNVVRKRWRARADPAGRISLTFPRVLVNQAVVSALSVSCSADDAMRMPVERRAEGYPASAGKTWRSLASEVAYELPDALIPQEERAKVFPTMASQPAPADQDGYKIGWFGPPQAKQYEVVFRVRSGNPIGRKLVWRLEADLRKGLIASGEFVVRETRDGKVVMKFPTEVNAGWYYLLYRMEGVELVATQWQ